MCTTKRKTEGTHHEKEHYLGSKSIDSNRAGQAGLDGFQTFKSARIADGWICDYCRKNGYSITDFNLVRREA